MILGAGAIAGGLATTAMGFGAHGRQQGQQQGMAAGEQRTQQLLAQQQTEFQALLNEMQATASAPQTDGTLGQPASAPSTTPTNTQPATIPTGADPSAGSAVAPAGGGEAAATITDWSPQALIGTGLDLPAGVSAHGKPIADPGRVAITTQVGAPAGYGTEQEALEAMRASSSVQQNGSKTFRALVLAYGDRFYVFHGRADDTAQTASLLPESAGRLAGWYALRYVQTGAEALDYSWSAYEWSQSGGARIFAPAA